MKAEKNKIYIYDNVFESHYTQKFYDFVNNSYFKIGTSDSACKDYEERKNFGSTFSKSDLKEMGLLDALPKKIKSKFNMSYKTVTRTLVNAITSYGLYHPHDDSGNHDIWSFLYYANMRWDLEWGADTLFLNDDRKSVRQHVQPLPNRVVVFDATIPHLIRPSTMHAPTFRYSINMTFGGKPNPQFEI